MLISALAAVAATLAMGSAVLPDQGTGRAKLAYTKVLQGSSPEYLSISVDRAGSGTYDGRKLDDPPHPRPLKLSDATTQKLFELAAALDDFRSVDLESHKRVANLGTKTLTYEEDGQKYQAQFNYSLRREAQELSELFEKIAAVEQHIVVLEYAAKYDHLSLPRELLQIQNPDRSQQQGPRRPAIDGARAGPDRAQSPLSAPRPGARSEHPGAPPEQ